MRQLMALAAGFSLVLSASAFGQTATKSVSASGSTAVVYANTGSGSSAPSITPSPTAPAFMVSSPCMGVVSGSGTSPTIGISIGMTYTDAKCEDRADAAEMFAMGHAEVARQIMCEDESVRKAAAAAGEPCDRPVVIHIAATQATAPAADPYGRAAFCKTLNWRKAEDRPYLETVCNNAG